MQFKQRGENKVNLSFIKLDINIMNDTKIKLIRKMPDGDSILVLWIGLLCIGMKSGKPGTLEIGDGIPFNDETLSVELDIPINTVRLGLETFIKFNMIEVWEDGSTFITNFEKHQELEKILRAKEKSRITSQRHRNKMKLLQSDGHVSISDKTDKDKEKEYSDEIKNFTASFQNYISEEYPTKAPKVNDSLLDRCNKTIDELIRLDGNTIEYVRSCLWWAVKDDFWSTQVYSLGSLRTKSKNGLKKFQNLSNAFDKQNFIKEEPTKEYMF